MANRVLVVDDESHIVQVVSLKLRNAGYDVITAPDGEEGYETACRERPDVIITDYQMPYMTGLELCRQLARNPATRKIPVLMLTARGYALDEDDLVVGNIRDVMSKPFSPRLIVAQVKKLLEGDDAHAEQTGAAGGEEGPSALGARRSAHSRDNIRPEAA
jgi:two-component system, OmpR family, alkaline phosphatase synthesis response regulator PhoP